MARNRKRAKERRARRPQPVPSRGREEPTGPPSPLEHAAPDAEIAEQAELPPDLTEPELEELELGVAEIEDDAEFEEEPEPQAGGGRGGRRGTRIGAELEDGGSAEPEAAAPVPAARAGTVNRLMTFLQGSWRELQRVQWPDRRQVMQATGVVIGFVIVAGVLLGVSDLVSSKIVNLVLYGHT